MILAGKKVTQKNKNDSFIKYVFCWMNSYLLLVKLRCIEKQQFEQVLIKVVPRVTIDSTFTYNIMWFMRKYLKISISFRFRSSTKLVILVSYRADLLSSVFGKLLSIDWYLHLIVEMLHMRLQKGILDTTLYSIYHKVYATAIKSKACIPNI